MNFAIKVSTFAYLVKFQFSSICPVCKDLPYVMFTLLYFISLFSMYIFS